MTEERTLIRKRDAADFENADGIKRVLGANTAIAGEFLTTF
jgi:hypothetical protein